MSWQRMPAAPIARSYATAVWTGSEVLFWGGRVPDGSLATDGAAFDPSTLAWRAIPEAPLEPRDPAAIVWTGSEMIVWGGGPTRAQTYTDGAAYDPASDSWRPIANAPIALNLASGIWTGHEVIVFGSNLNNRNIADTKTSVGEAYDPTTDTWRTLPPSQLSPQATSAVWLGDRMLAWDYDTHDQLYDPGTDSWTPPRPMPIEASECYPDSVTIGHLAFAWFCGDAALYDGDAGTWQRLGGGPLDQTIHTSKVDIKLWRFATLVPAGDAVLLAMEGVTLTKGGEACYGCPGAPHSLWVYRPIRVTGTPITPSASPFPEGSITVPRGTIPEGALLFQLGRTAEILPSGSDHSLRLGELRVQALSPDGHQVLAVDGDRFTAIDLSTGAQTRLAEVGAGEYILMAEWSPDGGFVAYRLGLGNPTGSSKACVVDVATQQQNCLSGLGDVYTLHWAPDGVHLIVAGPGQGVESVAIDTGEVSTLVPAEGSPTVTAALQQAGYGSPIQFVDPSWSPSGNYIGALANMRGGSAAYVPVVVDAQGRLVAMGKPSADFPGFDFGWSPAGDVFAYGVAYAPGDGQYVNEVSALNPVSGEDRLLDSIAAAAGHTIRGVVWSPTGQWVATEVLNWSDRGYVLPSDLRIASVGGEGSVRQFSFDSGGEGSRASWGPG